MILQIMLKGSAIIALIVVVAAYTVFRPFAKTFLWLNNVTSAAGNKLLDFLENKQPELLVQISLEDKFTPELKRAAKAITSLRSEPKRRRENV